MEDRATWRELFEFVTAYEQFVEQKRDVSFQDYAAVLDYARACPTVFEGEAGSKVKASLAEFDAVVAAREIMLKWKTLQEAALAVSDRYRQVYRAAFEACTQAIAQLRGEVEGATALTRLDAARRARAAPGDVGLPGGDFPAGRSGVAGPASGQPHAHDRSGAARRARFAAIKIGGAALVSQAEFEAFWQSLGAEVAVKFDEGHEVVIDE